MTATWVDLPGLFPLDRSGSTAQALRKDATKDLDDAHGKHEADLLLLAVVLLFLVGSFLVCRCCGRARRRHANKPSHARSYAYTLYQSNASGASSNSRERDPRGVLESVVSTATYVTPSTKPKTVLVSEMEEPFLGPPDYAQPPPYEMSPPAYEYLPSAPPLSDDASHSPRQV